MGRVYCCFMVFVSTVSWHWTLAVSACLQTPGSETFSSTCTGLGFMVDYTLLQPIHRAPPTSLLRDIFVQSRLCACCVAPVPAYWHRSTLIKTGKSYTAIFSITTWLAIAGMTLSSSFTLSSVFFSQCTVVHVLHPVYFNSMAYLLS